VEIRDEGARVEAIRDNLQLGLREVKQLQQGKGKPRPAQYLLNKL